MSTSRVYFGGMLLGATNETTTSDTTVFADRLGTVTPGYPYGTAVGSPAGNDQVDFATYMKDGSTGLDYAVNRHYGTVIARFLEVDPAPRMAAASIPTNWNKYTYGLADSVNVADPSGATVCDENGDNCYDEVMVTPQTGGEAPGGADPFCSVNRLGGCNGQDTIKLTPAMMRSIALALKAAVAQTPGYTECDALADYIGAAAENGNRLFVDKSLGIFVPNSYGLPAASGIFYSGDPVDLYSGGDNGFASQYQNSQPDGPNGNGDQVHHFAAFFELGYSYGASLSAAAAAAFESAEAAAKNQPVNSGDIALGDAAAQIGADLKDGKIGTGDVAGEVKKLCDE